MNRSPQPCSPALVEILDRLTDRSRGPGQLDITWRTKQTVSLTQTLTGTRLFRLFKGAKDVVQVVDKVTSLGKFVGVSGGFLLRYLEQECIWTRRPLKDIEKRRSGDQTPCSSLTLAVLSRPRTSWLCKPTSELLRSGGGVRRYP